MFYESLKRQYILKLNEDIKIVLMPFQEEEKSSTPTKTKEVSLYFEMGDLNVYVFLKVGGS